MNFNFRVVLILALGVVLGYGLNFFVSELIYKKYESSVTLDSVGLPPIPENVAPVGFDEKPQAPEKVKDKVKRANTGSKEPAGDLPWDT